VRFTPQSTGAKSGNVSNASTGATTQNVAVSGTGVPVLNVTTDPTVTEGNAGPTPATFTVTLTPASAQTVTVHYSTQDNSATTADNDYVAIPDTLLTFNPGETSKNINVTVNGDTTIEPNEQFFFNLNTPSNANISDNQGVGTITNDDTPSLSIGDVTQAEGNAGTTAFTFTVTKTGSGAASVDYATADGSAVSSSDYTAVPTTTLTFTSAETTKQFTVFVNGETTVEPSEAFFVNLSNVSGATIADAQGVGHVITDDLGTRGGKIVFSTNRDGNSEIYVMNADGTAQSRLTDTDVFVENTYPIFNPDGSKIAFVSTRDGNREIYIMNADGTNQTNITNVFQADDSGPTFSPDGSKIAFASQRFIDPAYNTDIYVMNTDGTGLTRITTDPADDFYPSYSPDGGRIVFTTNREGEYDNEIYIMSSNGGGQTNLTNNNLIGDFFPTFSPDGSKIVFESHRDGEIPEIYTMSPSGANVVRLTNNSDIDDFPTFSPDGSKVAFESLRDGNTPEIYVMNSDGNNVVRITFASGADSNPRWAVGDVTAFSIDDVTHAEGNAGTTSYTFTVTKTGPAAGSVNFTTVDNSATVAGNDYVANSGTLNFDTADTTRQFTVLVNGDATVESDEAFTVTLSNPVGALISDAVGVGTVTNDDANTPTINVTGGPLTFPDTVVGSTSDEETYTVSGSNLTDDLVVTAPSTDFQVSATSGSGFGPSVSLTPSSGTVASTTIYVRFTPQSAGSKSGNVTNASTGATTQNVAVSGTGIQPQPGTLQFSSATYSVGEGAGSIVVSVTRTGGSDGAVAVQYVTSDGTAAAGSDYTPLSDGLVWANGDTAAKTFTVPILDDALYEGDETFVITLNAPSGATLGAPSTTTVTINDNESQPAVSVGDVTLAEPSSGISYAVFPLTLSVASAQTVAVNFATADGSAVAPGDYSSAAGTVTFAAGETSKTVAVIVKADAVSEPSESFGLNLSSPSNATLSDGAAVANITAPVGPGSVLISEFRLRGTGDPNSALVDADRPVEMRAPGRKGGRPSMDTLGEADESPTPQPPVIDLGEEGGPSAAPTPPETDEFIELYNNTDADIIVSDANPVTCLAQLILSPLEKCGWALVDLQGSVSNIPRFVIPVGTVIPARGHYLAASTGYSLSALAAPDQTYSPPAYSGGEADYTGLALFKTADRAQFTQANVFDAVGFDGVATPYREGSGLLPLAGVGEDVQFSFVRNQTSSRPSDTGDNRADFTLVATTPSLLTSGTATLGAPGPENSAGLVSRNSGFAVSIPPGVASSLRVNTAVTNGSLGTLSLRRRFTNNTGQTLSKLRFRVVQVTTYNSKQVFPTQAEMRLLDAQLAGLPGSVKATTVETPPAQTGGGGVNTGLLVSGSMTLAQPLAAGQSVDVEFLLGVMKSGSYQFVIVVEGAQ
jgi:Tol biopolymer transport system component